jgi:hypothetical protein
MFNWAAGGSTDNYGIAAPGWCASNQCEKGSVRQTRVIQKRELKRLLHRAQDIRAMDRPVIDLGFSLQSCLV